MYIENWDTQGIEELQSKTIKQLQTIVSRKSHRTCLYNRGAKGTGKTKVMQFFVQLLLCENPTKSVPCETCRSCKRLKSNNHLNFMQLEPDGQNIKKAQIDDLIHEMSKTAMETGRKIYVIHHADQLNAKCSKYTIEVFRGTPE